ncbi:MAG: proline--tRNA ligase, partial [Clostridia bacterium]|nr:proline--tRNA ligase [Clostridia bacterium]
FAPEVAWVTHGGSEKLQERLCVRPTSETLFCEHYSNIIQSYRDLPKLYNQWCSVVRWEKTTRPFLRTTEFLWQEGHTMHETAEEALAETEQMLNVYADFCEEMLAIPVVKGRKTDKEKFAGAEATYTIEAMMHDGKALQSGTSHYFGDGFARAFDIQFVDRNNQLQYPHQTSWGMSTRIIGGIIMTHGDDNGLVLPPKIAPTQLIIIPIAAHKPGVTEKAQELCDSLKSVCRVKIDDSKQTPGWKFAEYEMKGVPLRLEIGPRDLENNCCVIVRRDNREKTVVSLDELSTVIPELLQKVHDGLYEKALKRRESMTYDAHTMEEMIEIAENKPGLVRAMWCGDLACEEAIKEKAGLTSRCMPFEQEEIDTVCPCCGKPAKALVYWGKQY